jgi:molybdopterin-guanine dinucleotide biosynthesis protein A
MSDRDPTPPVAACILAGGLSTRMGAPDKGLAEVGGRSMAARVAEALAADGASVAIVANGDPSRFAALGVPVVADPPGAAGKGPLAGVLAGIAWARSAVPAARHLVTAPSDTPFLPEGLVDALLDAAAGTDGVVVARSGGALHPVVAAWPIAAEASIRDALSRGELKLGAVQQRLGRVAVDIPPLRVGMETIDPLMNVNTPEQLVEARRVAGMLDSAIPLSGTGHT